MYAFSNLITLGCVCVYMQTSFYVWLDVGEVSLYVDFSLGLSRVQIRREWKAEKCVCAWISITTRLQHTFCVCGKVASYSHVLIAKCVWRERGESDSYTREFPNFRSLLFLLLSFKLELRVERSAAVYVMLRVLVIGGATGCKCLRWASCNSRPCSAGGL